MAKIETGYSWEEPRSTRPKFYGGVSRTRGRTPLPPLEEYEIEALPEYSEIASHEMGEENFYFTLTNGTDGYVKL